MKYKKFQQTIISGYTHINIFKGIKMEKNVLKTYHILLSQTIQRLRKILLQPLWSTTMDYLLS